MLRKLSIGLILIILTLLISSFVAADINDFKGDALVVIAQDAEPEDLVGGVGLATYETTIEPSPLAKMYQAGMIKIPDGYERTVQILGDAVEIGNGNDKLEPVERIGNVKPLITGDDTPTLAPRMLSTQKGTTKYNQYIRFEDGASGSDDYIANGYASLRVNEQEEVNAYLLFAEDDRMFGYDMEFEEGLKSGIECVNEGCTSADKRKLDDLEGMKLDMLGTEFTILRARANTDDNSIEIRLVGDGQTEIIEEGETKTLNIDGKEYEVTVVIVSDWAGSNGDAKVKLKINGLLTKEYQAGEVDRFEDLYLGISEVLPNEAGETSGGDMVKTTLGKKSILFKDDDYTDDTAKKNIEIDGETVQGTELKIRATDTEDVMRISNIKYRVKAESKDGGTIYIPPGQGIKDQMKHPEAMLTENWDLKYYGGSPDPFMQATRLEFLPQGDDAYKMKFENMEGLKYSIPFVDNSETFKYGDEDQNLQFTECSSSSDYCIKRKDYMIFTAGTATYPKGSDTSTTRVLRYDSIESAEQIVTFEDMATGTIQATYTGTEGVNAQGTVFVAGKDYTFYVGTGPDYNLSIDLNDDNDVASDEVNAIIKGGAIVDLGANQDPDLTGGNDAFNITIMTITNKFDENGWLDLGLPEVMYLTMNEETNNEVDIDATQTTTGIKKYKFDEVDGYLGSSAYGATVLESAESGESDFIKILYPSKQVRPQVYATFGQVQVIPLSVTPLLGPIRMETFMDEPTTEALLEKAKAGLGQVTAKVKGLDQQIKPKAGLKLDTEVTTDDANGRDVVLVGGPCVNKIVEKLAEKGKTLTCDEWQTKTGGMIQSLDTDYGTTYIVAGQTGADTVRAATLLQSIKYYENSLEGQKLIYVDEKGDLRLPET